jgi:hypothetical protein
MAKLGIFIIVCLIGGVALYGFLDLGLVAVINALESISVANLLPGTQCKLANRRPQ